jgi:DNA-binding transcriptional LysR family regulator
VEVVRRESLAAAARQLGVPKSTVSRRLKRLEEQLGIELVNRETRAVSPTPEGMRFFEAVVDAIDELDHAVATVEQSTTEPRGTVRVTSPSDLGRMLVIPALVVFLERYPDIVLDLVVTNRFVDLVQERVDLAVRAGPVHEPHLIARKLRPANFVLACSPDRDVACDDVSELARHPFVLYRKRGQAQVIRLERSASGQEESVELAVSGSVNVDDYAAMVELVAAGRGIGLMPSLHAEEGVRQGRLVRLFPEWSTPGMPVQLVYSSRHQPERVRLLIEYLTEALAV